MIQYLIIAILGFLSMTAMCMFLFVKEGTKGIKQKPYKTKSGITHTAEKSRTKFIV